MNRIDLPRITSRLRQVQHGDRVAFEDFYAETAPTYFAIALQSLRDGERAEKVLEDFFVKISYDSDLQQLILERLTAASQNLEAKAFDQSVLGYDNRVAESRDAFKFNLEGAPKPAKQRISDAQCALNLQYFFGLSLEEISEHLDRPVANIAELIHEAIDCLDCRSPETND